MQDMQDIYAYSENVSTTTKNNEYQINYEKKMYGTKFY